MQTKSVQKFITFSPKLYRLAADKAHRFGISIGDYLRYLIVEDVKDEVEELPMVDAQTNKDIGQALKDIKQGRYTRVKTDAQLEEFLGSLKKGI